MALPVIDNFTAAADAALQTYSANWVINSGALTVNATGDYVQCDTVGSYSAAHWQGDTFAADQYAQVKISLKAGSSDWIGPAVRAHASANTYYGVFASVNFGANSIYLSKIVAGTLTDLAFVDGVAVAAGDVLRLEIVGTALTVKRNGTAVAGLTNITDSSIATGYGGLCGYGEGGDTSSWMDDFEAGNLGGAPVEMPAALLRPRRYFMIDSWR